nr:hypothetical protein [Escherichia coli R178]CED95585.1 hypothetical protein [Salmonella enterica subsp. enterica serovar Infantis]
MLTLLNAGGQLEVKYTLDKQTNRTKVCTKCLRVIKDINHQYSATEVKHGQS